MGASASARGSVLALYYMFGTAWQASDVAMRSPSTHEQGCSGCKLVVQFHVLVDDRSNERSSARSTIRPVTDGDDGAVARSFACHSCSADAADAADAATTTTIPRPSCQTLEH